MRLDYLKQLDLGERKSNQNQLKKAMMNNRRNFLKAGILATAAVGLPSGQSEAKTFQGEVKSYRRLGRTNLEISDISFGTSRLRTGEEHLIAVSYTHLTLPTIYSV